MWTGRETVSTIDDTKSSGTSGTVSATAEPTAMVLFADLRKRKVRVRVQGTVSGLQSEYARARSTGCAESTGDGR